MTNPLLFFVQIALLGAAEATGAYQERRTPMIIQPLFNEDCAELPRIAEAWKPPTATATTEHIRSLRCWQTFSGHAGWPPATAMTNPLLFFVQVSRTHSTIKTSDRCFIQLACPHSLSALCLYVKEFVVSLLLLSGDVESNPGPTVEELLEQLLEGQKNVEKRLDAIDLKLKLVESCVSEVKEFGGKLSALEKTVQRLEKQIVDLEDRGRRNNLLVFGVPEKEEETAESLMKEVVDDIFQAKLNVKVSSVERIHRIGRKQPEKSRPIILRLIDHREKLSVLKNCFNLKGSDISISEDFSPATREIRRHLWKSTADARNSGAKVQLYYDKIKVDKTMFAWDSNQKKMVPSSRSTNEPKKTE
ncbi:uncharacterized protein LOC144156367 [Haemaphysalis longicornis]